MDETAIEPLVTHLVRTTPLARDEAARVVADVLAFFGEETEGYVRRRHAELQRRGLTNSAIFEQIAEELAQRRVAAPALSQRQIRRLIYG